MSVVWAERDIYFLFIKNLGTWKPDGSLGECGYGTKATNIIGGEIAAIGEFPYMALIGYKEPRFSKVDHIPKGISLLRLLSYQCFGYGGCYRPKRFWFLVSSKSRRIKIFL